MTRDSGVKTKSKKLSMHDLIICLLCHAIPCYAILLCCILYLLFLISLVYLSNVSMCHTLLKKVCFYLISIHPQSDAVTFFQTHCLYTVKWVAMWYAWCYFKCYIFWYNLIMRLLISYFDRTILKLKPVSSFFSNRLTTLTVTESASYECFRRLTV